MPSKPVTSALGLYRTPNPLGGAQDGGYRELRNCVIRSKDTIEPRLGQLQVSAWIGNNSSDTRRINALFASSIGTLAQYGSGSTSGVGLLELLGTAILSNVDPPSAWLRTKFADCQKRAYFTSSNGLRRIDSSGAGAYAGGLRPIMGSGHLSFAVYNASGFLPLNSACMYRAELVTLAPDGAEIVGPPSGRAVIRVPPARTASAGGVVRTSNVITVTTTEAHGFKVGSNVLAAFDGADDDVNEFTNGTKTIASVPTSTTFTIAETAANYTSTAAATFSLGPAVGSMLILLPSTATSSTIIRLYRSERTETYDAVPSDNVYKVYEAKLTAANVSAGYVVVTDNTPEVLLGDPSYFSPEVEGEGQANETPPLMHDVCELGGVLFGVNLLDPHRLELRLIATGGSTGIAATETITFTRGAASFMMTGSTSSYADGYFIVYDGGTVARDIENTAQSLVDGINSATGNTFLRAEYVSTGDRAPGSILLTADDFSTTAITVTSTKGAAFAPNILGTGTATTSKQVPDYAGICWTKPGQPDAWPGGNRAQVGSPSEYALRCLATREKVVVLKEKTAHLVSSGGGIRIDPLDDTCEFPLPDTAAVMDNQVYALSSIGVVAVSEGGVINMGSPIEGDLRPVIEQAVRVKALLNTYSTVPCLASWGASDEVEHRYLLAVPASVKLPPSGTALDQNFEVDNIWVFNANGKGWSGPWPTKHRAAAGWSGASSSGRLVFARNDRPGVLKEQGVDQPEAIRYSDYLGHSAYVTAKSGTALTLAPASGGAPDVGTLEVGDALFNSSTGWYSVISSITSRSAGTVVVDSAAGISEGASYAVLKRIKVRVEPVRQSQDAFPSGKQVTGFNLALSDARFKVATVYMGNERSGFREAKVLARPGLGAAAFGRSGCGDPPGLVKERGQVPKNAARGDFHSLALVVEEAGAFFRLHSFAFDFEVGSPKVTK